MPAGSARPPVCTGSATRATQPTPDPPCQCQPAGTHRQSAPQADHRDTVALLKHHQVGWAGPPGRSRRCWWTCTLGHLISATSPFDLGSHHHSSHVDCEQGASWPPSKTPNATPPSVQEIADSGDKLLLEKLTDAIAITIRLHSQASASTCWGDARVRGSVPAAVGLALQCTNGAVVQPRVASNQPGQGQPRPQTAPFKWSSGHDPAWLARGSRPSLPD